MSTEKISLHTRNLHRSAYDFEVLVSCVPELKHYVFENNYHTKTINFSIPRAVKLLNKALLMHFYKLEYWDIPENNLCPPIPGRADYVHYIADLLSENSNDFQKKEKVKGLDIGAGANLIYPIIAHQTYGWEMLGTDINRDSLQNAEEILSHNPQITSIQLKHQSNSQSIFKNIIEPEDRFDFSMCNPPFHRSEEEAMKGNIRKTKNLNKKKVHQPLLNFKGQQSELWCDGGELTFISNMIKESAYYASQIRWFTCLVSKKENISPLTKLLNQQKKCTYKMVDMAQGQKVSRFLAWTFQQEKW